MDYGIIVSDNGFTPNKHQAIIQTNANMLFIGHVEINFSEISIKIQQFPLQKMNLKMTSLKLRLFCLGLNIVGGIHTNKEGIGIFDSLNLCGLIGLHID